MYSPGVEPIKLLLAVLVIIRWTTEGEDVESARIFPLNVAT